MLSGTMLREHTLFFGATMKDGKTGGEFLFWVTPTKSTASGPHGWVRLCMEYVPASQRHSYEFQWLGLPWELALSSPTSLCDVAVNCAAWSCDTPLRRDPGPSRGYLGGARDGATANGRQQDEGCSRCMSGLLMNSWAGTATATRQRLYVQYVHTYYSE
jgi:hypothetical protein